MTRYTMTIPAGEHERFAPHSWDSQIGREVQIVLRETDDGPVIAAMGRGRVVAAEVAEDGTSVTLTIEVTEQHDDTA